MATASRLCTSRYNFAIRTKNGTLLYCARTGAVLRLEGPDSETVAQVLCRWPHEIRRSEFDETTLTNLVRGGFVLNPEADELLAIRGHYWEARKRTPLVLTITTTLDCNLACYYCYESRSEHRLQLQDVNDLINLARGRLIASGKRRLHVDWYGGEPLLNLEFMESASSELQAMCGQLGAAYVASVISNGTCWPSEIGSFVERNAIRQVQISFDGMRKNHDRRRRYLSARSHGGQSSSFDRIVALVDELLDVVRVDLRYNADRKNVPDVVPFIRFAGERGWFRRAFPAIVQLARISAYSEHSEFLREVQLSADEYDDLRTLVRNELRGLATVEESEAPEGFPYPRRSVCAALANHSAVVGADRKLYRCGLQVSEPHRAVGNLAEPADKLNGRLFPIVERDDTEWWEQFDPTRQPSCCRCSFLPICWGGCPKKHLESDRQALDEQGRFWRSNLARLVVSKTGDELLGSGAFSESDQFRGGDEQCEGGNGFLQGQPQPLT